MKKKITVFLLSLLFVFTMFSSITTVWAAPGKKPGGGDNTVYTSVNHIDIAVDLEAKFFINGELKSEEFTISKSDAKYVTITADPSDTDFSTSGGVSTSTDNAGNKQVRLDGTFPIGTQESPIYYTVTLNKTINTKEGYNIPVTLSTTMHYWDSGNVCPGYSVSPGRMSGIDLDLNNELKGNIQIQVTVNGADITEDKTFYFDVYKSDGSVFTEDVAITVPAGETTASKILSNVDIDTYTIIEDEASVQMEGYDSSSITYTNEGVVNLSDNNNAIVNITNTYTKTEIPPETEEPPATTPEEPPVQTENKITISYNGNTGSGEMEDSIHAVENEDLLSFNTFTKKGYSFMGWATAPDEEPVYNDEELVKKLELAAGEKIELFAKWKANNYQIIYDGNGGTDIAMENSVHEYDIPQNLSSNTFSRKGYSFMGWNRAADGSGDSYVNEEEVTNLTEENGAYVTLYAMWKQIPEVTVNITGQKVLFDEMGEHMELQDNQFAFELSDGINATVESFNAADGSIDFGSLTFTEEGTYCYTIKEIPNNNCLVLYDNTVYEAIINVLYSEETGTLEAAVTYRRNGEDYAFTEGAAGIIFQNTSVQIRATVPMYVCMRGFAGDGEVVEPTEYGITNYSQIPIKITNVKASGGWELLPDKDSLQAGQLYMELNGMVLNNEENQIKNETLWIIPKAADFQNKIGTFLHLPLTCYIAGGNVNAEGCHSVVNVEYTVEAVQCNPL